MTTDSGITPNDGMVCHSSNDNASSFKLETSSTFIKEDSQLKWPVPGRQATRKTQNKRQEQQGRRMVSFIKSISKIQIIPKKSRTI
jgi:hypothetical protein